MMVFFLVITRTAHEPQSCLAQQSEGHHQTRSSQVSRCLCWVCFQSWNNKYSCSNSSRDDDASLDVARAADEFRT
eukprot:4090151-Pyramimonas_sp.AAC.1